MLAEAVAGDADGDEVSRKDLQRKDSLLGRMSQMGLELKQADFLQVGLHDE